MAKFKRILTISVMVMTVFSMSVVVVPQVDATASSGDLIKMDGLSSVYYLGADGKRYVFPNEQTYFSWYSDFSSVVIIPQSELESYSLGANVTMRPGTKLVKITTDPKVYAVESNGTLKWVSDEATALALYGTDWAKRVIDVPDAFFTNYTVSEENVSATAYPEGSLIKTATSSDVYYINADGTASKVASEAAFLANRLKFSDVITTTLTIPEVGDEITESNLLMIDTSQGGGAGTGISADAGTGLTVALASDTPASNSLPQGASGVDFTKVNFTATNDGDITIKNLVVTRTGVGLAADFAGVWIYDTEGNRLTSSRTISSSSNKVTFNGLNYEVGAGTTKALVIKATVSGVTGNNGFAINLASDITTDGASVSGSFPIAGNVMSLTGVLAGSIEYTLSSVENTALKVGELQKEVADIKLTTGGNEDITLYSIALTNDGSADENDLKNFKLYQGATLVAELETVDTDRALFVLTTPLVISKGASKNFSLKADIMGGVATAGSIIYDVDDLTDIVAVGNSYKFGVSVASLNSNTSSISVAAGEFTIEIDGPSAYDVVADANDVVLANMTFTTGGEEAIEVENMYAYIDCIDFGAGTEKLQVGMDNVQLVNLDNDEHYDGTTNDAVTDDNYYFKVTNFTVPAGVSSWRVEMDLSNSYFADGDVCTFNIHAGDNIAETEAAKTTADYKGIEAKNQAGKALNDIKPNALISGNNVTVQTASLAISNIALNNGNAVSKTKDVNLMKFSAEAGSAEDIKLTQVILDKDGTLLVSQASNYTLVDEDGVKYKEGVSAVSDVITFSSLTNGGVLIPAGETKIFYITADINSNIAGVTLSVRMKENGVLAEDSDGDSLDAGDITGDTIAVNGRVITLQDQGSIEFTMDSSSPSNPHILLSSSEENSVLYFKANASYEDIVIKDLIFDITGTNATASISSVSLYQDEAFVKQVSNVTGFTVVFNGLEGLATPVVVKSDEDSVFELRYSVAGIGDGDEDTATSANTIDFTLTDATNVIARGDSSNNDLTSNEITVTSVASQENVIYASKVVASLNSTQPENLSDGEQEAMKFTLTPDSNDSKTAQFTEATVNVTPSSATAIVSDVAIYSGSTQLGTTSTSFAAGVGGDVTIGSFVDDISAGGETYTVKITVTDSGENDKMTVRMDVNGGTDDITWRDYSDGATTISWIDLGEGSDVSTLENQLVY